MWKPDLTHGSDREINPWNAVWFATVLCLMMLVGSVLPFLPTNPALPGFYAFLPVVFLLIGLWERRSDSRATALEQRVKELETKLAANKNGAG